MDNVISFGFRFDPAYQRLGSVFGVRPANARVAVGPERLDAHFGPWHLSTPISNITGAEVTGPYRFFKTAGPARLAVTDRGLTFATNGDRGVLLTFERAERGLDPLGILRHPELTVTVADVDALARLLAERRAHLRPGS